MRDVFEATVKTKAEILEMAVYLGYTIIPNLIDKDLIEFIATSGRRLFTVKRIFELSGKKIKVIESKSEYDFYSTQEALYFANWWLRDIHRREYV